MEYKTIIDHYYGSGSKFKKSLSTYGHRNFKVEIVKFARDGDELNKLEEEYITFDDLNNPLCLNKITGGDCGKGHTNPKYYVKTYMFSLDGKLEKTFDSVKSAVKYLTDETKTQCVKTAITACMTGRCRSYKNHLWSYTPDPPTARSWKRLVYVFDEHGEFITSTVSCMEAAKWLATKLALSTPLTSISASISFCCKKTLKSYKGFQFSYENDINGKIERKSLKLHSRKKR